MNYQKEDHTITLKVTPRFNKHHSYDELSIALKIKEANTLVFLQYECHPRSFMEKVFAVILNHEEQLFETWSEQLFQNIHQSLLAYMYG